MGGIIKVNAKTQTNYFYELFAPIGTDFPDRFQPFYAPKEMLEMGVFEGKYCSDCVGEFPAD